MDQVFFRQVCLVPITCALVEFSHFNLAVSSPSSLAFSMKTAVDQGGNIL